MTDRKSEILDAALSLAASRGLAAVTGPKVAEAAGVSRPLVANYWGTMTQLRRAVMRAAVKRECLPVLAEMIATRASVKVPDVLRDRALESLK